MNKDRCTTPVLIQDKRMCCGCGTCVAICPQNAIKLNADDEGFVYPEINSDKCIGCKQCVNICCFKNNSVSSNTEPEVYAAYLRDNDALRKSSSGGIFTAVSDVILEQGGAVACSVFDYTSKELKFSIVTNKSERDAARGSKYVQSNPNEIHKKCYEWIEENPGKKLLFIGTGCQTDGFKAFAERKKISESIYFADIICHGVPSPKFFSDYIEVYCNGLTDITFKNKNNGWERPAASAQTTNGVVSLQPYVDIFNQDYNLRPSCYSCPYTTIRRNSDITIGDYWGIQKVHPEFYNRMGVSLILVHTEQGKELIKKITNEIEIIPSNVSACLQPNLQHPTTEPKDRSKFWSLYMKKGIVCVVKKYSYVGITNKLKRKLYSKIKRV